MVEPRTAHADDAISAVIALVVAGPVLAGDNLVPSQLADTLGVSTASVSNALRDLAMVGLVVESADEGSYVAEFTTSGMHDIFAVRGALEELATRIALPTLSRDVSGLQREVDAMVRAANEGDTEAVGAHSLTFHSMIVDAADNPVLSQMWRTLNVDAHTKVTVHQMISHLVALAETHQPIVDSIASGDVERACTVARSHQDALDEITHRHSKAY